MWFLRDEPPETADFRLTNDFKRRFPFFAFVIVQTLCGLVKSPECASDKMPSFQFHADAEYTGHTKVDIPTPPR